MYSSKQGDLVAEFDAPNGRLTSIVSPKFVVLFSVVNGIPSNTVIDEGGAVRAEVQGVLKPLLAR